MIKQAGFFFASTLLFTLLLSAASCQSGQAPARSEEAVDPVATTQPEPPASAGPQSPAPETTPDITQSDMWRVGLVSFEFAESLTATLAAIQYGGDILETTSEVTPGLGNVFLLLELEIEKIGTGRAAFSWGDTHVEDGAGNAYYRHPNDTFLSNLNIPRIRGTDIVLGLEYGFVCFEVPKGVSGLRFVADEGEIRFMIHDG